MQLSTDERAAATVIRVPARRIDAAVAVKFKDAMRSLTEGPDRRYVLDLTEVEFIDSSGLGAVVGALKQVGTGSTLELAALSPNVDKVFRLTRMDSVFRILTPTDLASLDIAHAS